MKEGLGRTLNTKAHPHNGITNTMGGEAMGHSLQKDCGIWTLDFGLD